jgi:pimeloyl-ACP methyl ester carboxylesterase
MMERFAAPSGSSIAFDAVGTGRPVLALHGVGGGAYFFRGFAQRVASQHRVIAVDLPGTGRSQAAPGAMSLETWIADLGALVAATIGQPVAIVGHSLGTILALEAWAAWSSRIDRLVFVGGLPEVRPLIRERLGARVDALKGATSLGGWGERVSPGNFSPAALARRPEAVGLFERAFEMQPVESYTRSLEILLGASATAIVPSVTVPCLSVSGADDQYAPPDVVSTFLDALPSPSERHVWPDVGHLPFFEAPEEFARVVGEFLDRT